MRFLAIVFAAVLALGSASPASAQAAFTDAAAGYALDLPGETWRVAQEPDSLQGHAEFVYGDRESGYLRICKEVVEVGTTPADLAGRDVDQKLKFQTGYVEGKLERFAGRLGRVTLGYEYTAGGRAMAGRLYYLQAGETGIYVLRFTGLRDRLAGDTQPDPRDRP
jgi:hypothetical protein